MKKLIYLFLFTFITSSIFISCEDDDDNLTDIKSSFKTVTLGAQTSSTNGFYSISEDQTYDLAGAASNSANIDLLFYYDDAKTKMTLSSGGANLDGVFTGENDPQLWNVADTTLFTQVDPAVLNTDQFDALLADNTQIENLFDENNSNRKAKNLVVGDIYAFITEDNEYGLFKVVAVSPDTDGTLATITFTYILKEN